MTALVEMGQFMRKGFQHSSLLLDRRVALYVDVCSTYMDALEEGETEVEGSAALVERT